MSAICLNLDQSKILLSGNGLNLKYNALKYHWHMNRIFCINGLCKVFDPWGGTNLGIGAEIWGYDLMCACKGQSDEGTCQFQ